MSEQVKAQQNERQSNERNSKQNRKATINPYAEKVLALRRVVFEVVTVERLREILQVVCRLAERGHLGAIRLLLAYVVGRPDRPIEVDWEDREEVAAQQPATTPARQAPEPAAPPQSEESRQQQQQKQLEQLRALDTATLATEAKDDKLMKLIAGALELPTVAQRLVSPRR